MKKIVSAFAVTGVLSINNLSAVTSEYITNTIDIITQIDSKEKIKKNYSKIEENILLLEKSDKEFQEKVITFMLENYKEMDYYNFGQELANIALTLKGRDIRYDVIIDVFKKDRNLITYNKKIIELKNNNKIIKEKIQEVINLVFIHIEAKGTFAIAKNVLETEKTSDILLKDYWYTKDFEDEDKVLFISINQNDNIDLDSIYNLEDKINTLIGKTAEIKKETYEKLRINNNSKTGEYSFEAISKSFFKRVSIV